MGPELATPGSVVRHVTYCATQPSIFSSDPLALQFPRLNIDLGHLTNLPTIPARPKVVTMVVKAALGDASPRPRIDPSPAV